MIAIKDMEMPSDCYDCPFAKNKRTNDYGSFCECGILEDYETINLYEHSKHPNCPLVEIEENTPHNNAEILDVKKLNGLFPKNKREEKTEWTSKINFNKAD